MTDPTITIRPRRNGIGRDGGALELMIRIAPPPPAPAAGRPALNLALVIDRSGSMSGESLRYAKEAARLAVAGLGPDDRVAVVAYDTTAEVVVPSTHATDKAAILRAIDGVTVGGTTALHAGWLEGATEVGRHLASGAQGGRLDRVILLSDGLANVGETDPAVIQADVAGLFERGISTTTMGLGRQFNEDLLEGMAASGGGNYYFIESPEQLQGIFASELGSLVGTRGENVTLAFDLAAGVTLAEVYNPLPSAGPAAVRLPNLIDGMPLELAVRLEAGALEQEALRTALTLTWQDAAGGSRRRDAALTVPVLPSADAAALPEDPEVAAYLATVLAARAKIEAVSHLDRGDRRAMREALERGRRLLHAAPKTARSLAELEDLAHLEEALALEDERLFRKRSTYQAYLTATSRSVPGNAPDIRLLHTVTRPDGSSSRLEVTVGDITNESLDAIVNSTNSHLYGVVGVDGAIHQRGGPALTRACREIGHCDRGKAVFTPGFDLPARYVIHAVGPRWNGGNSGEAKVLASCYRAALALAQRLGIRTIAFPAIATGTYAYPRDEAAHIATGEILDHLRRHSGLELVRIVCFDEATVAAYREALEGVGV